MGNRQWLSEGAEVLVRDLEASQAHDHDCDVLIVGSGYGGAVAAARLAGARDARGDGRAIRVFVLERGREYLPGMFPSRFADIPAHVRFSVQDGGPPRGRAEGLFDVRLGETTNVIVASGLGGGSLINAAVMERPRDEAFAGNWPRDLDRESLDDAYRTAESMLQIDDFSSTSEQPKLRSLFALGKAMGAECRRRAALAIHPADGRTGAGVARSKCLQCGDCVSGCNHGAKNSLDVNYLKLAHAQGARFFCGATVHRVQPRGDGAPGWNVGFFLTDRSKGYAEADPLFVVRAKRVVLAAGTLGSTEILLRSRGPGFELSDMVGQRFSGNGDMIHAAWRQGLPAHGSAREQDPPAERGIGPTINGMVFKRRDDAAGGNPWLLYQEFAIPAPLRRVLGEVVTTFGTLFATARPDESDHRADFDGDDPASVGDEALDHTAVYGVMGDDGAHGTIALAPGADGVLADGQACIVSSAGAMYHEQLALLRRAQAAAAELNGIVVPNPLWEPLPGAQGLLRRTTTVHPLGGCRMADHTTDGVVDHCGRVFRLDGGMHDGLAVLDGSIVPCALGVNPALTIAALAERAMPLLMKAWGLDAAPAAAPIDQAQPRWSPPPAASRPQPTAVELRERMTGTLELGGASFDASLTIGFAPIDDLQAFVRRLPRQVALPSALLTLSAPGDAQVTVIASGVANVLHRADSTAASRRAAVQAVMGNYPEEIREFLSSTHHGEVRTIEYVLTVHDVQGAGPDFALHATDRLRLTKRLALVDDGASPWRQLSEAAVEIESGGHRHDAGRLCLDPSYFVEQAIPLLRVLAQQDQPNALGDLTELALLVARLVVKIRWPDLLAALARSFELDELLPSAAKERPPGPFRYRNGERIVEPWRQAHPVAATSAVLTRYRPPGGRTAGRPVMLIHGLGASGSTFAHWSIGAKEEAPGGDVTSNNLVAALLRAGRDVWVLDLRTSIMQARRDHWALEDVATGDIGPAVDTLLALRRAKPGAPEDKVDVVAHCIGAAMFCVAALGGADSGGRPLHERIGAVVLSQVGPLLRMGAMNRFRGYVASYLQQFVDALVFDVRPDEETLPLKLLDALLSTFPYPAGDRERERARAVPGFEVIRHRADAIWGRLMELDNVGDETLRALDAIYGWVVVRTLAQTIHFARHQLLTDASGANQVIAQANLAQRFGFPVLLLHGQRNAMFDWQGSYDSLRLLKQTFADDDGVPGAHPPDGGTLVFGAGTPRQLRVVAGYGHQDCLIGARAHEDVFPSIVEFLCASARQEPGRSDHRPAQLVADLPWMGPTLGWVQARLHERVLRCRLALQASPARMDTLALVFVPAHHRDGRWSFDLDHAAAVTTCRSKLIEEPVDVELALDHLPRHDGFVVLTLHNDIPVERGPDMRLAHKVLPGLFVAPSQPPDDDERAAVQRALDRAGKDVEFGVVRFDRAWIDGADRGAPAAAPGDALSFVVASCQYPPGLVDRAPAARSYERLVRRLDENPAARPQWLLLLGDQIYADATAGLFDPHPDDACERSYDITFRMRAFREATRRLPTCFMLDDHEVYDNWEPERARDDAMHATVRKALAAYRGHQHKLAPDGAADAPFRYAMHPAGFPLFVLDARSRRQARVLRGGGALLEDARMVPDAVLDAVKAWLDACPKAAPKFIASPTVVFPFERVAVKGAEAQRLALDSWSGFPASLVALLDMIVQGSHQNVVFLSGDAHLSLVSSLAIAGAGGASATVHSIVASGLHAPWPFANARPEDLLLDGDFEFRQRGRVALRGTASTAALGTTQGFCRVDVRAMPAGRWLLGVELDLADGVTACERMLGPAGPVEPWRVQRSRA